MIPVINGMIFLSCSPIQLEIFPIASVQNPEPKPVRLGNAELCTSFLSMQFECFGGGRF